MEGEWDAMLLWEYCPDLCDAGTLGGAAAKFTELDLSLLTRYPVILAVHDDDQAGEQGRRYIASLQAQIPRLRLVPPPAHDLTDFWKSGGSLRGWVAGLVAEALKETLAGITATSPAVERWRRVQSWAEKQRVSSG